MVRVLSVFPAAIRARSYAARRTCKKGLRPPFCANSGTVPFFALAAAAEGGEPAADDEPGDRGADDRLLLMTAQVAAPVGRQLDLAAQAVHGGDELLAVLLDRVADLFR